MVIPSDFTLSHLHLQAVEALVIDAASILQRTLLPMTARAHVLEEVSLPKGGVRQWYHK